MSFTTIRYLYCDGPLCEGDGEPYSVAPSPDEPISDQRAHARTEGWTRTTDGRDLCAECRAVERAAPKPETKTP